MWRVIKPGRERLLLAKSGYQDLCPGPATVLQAVLVPLPLSLLPPGKYDERAQYTFFGCSHRKQNVLEG